MASPYLISKFSDPLFAVSIGAAAAWVRIRREELSRFNASESSSDATPPTHTNTLNTLRERLSRVDPRDWNWRGVYQSKDRKRWGIVDEPGGGI